MNARHKQPQPRTVKCEQCDAEFTAYAAHAKWCSDECYNDKRAETERAPWKPPATHTRPCRACGATFTYTREGKGSVRYNCDACRYPKARGKIKVRLDSQEPCNGNYTLVCPRVDCHRNCANDGKRPSSIVSLSRLRCSLAVAEEGPHTAEEVADLMGVSTSRVQQLTDKAIAKLRRLNWMKEHTE